MQIQMKNSALERIAQECGLYIAEDNPEVTADEVEFFVEKVLEEAIAVLDQLRDPAAVNYSPKARAIEAIKLHFKL